MDTERLGSGNRICTVVFVDLVRYSEESVSRQVEMKTRFGALLASALEHTPVADRLVLDTGDGAALCFLGDPEDALFVANSLRTGVLELSDAHGLQLRLGINLGPVRVVKDINGHTNVLGDGINVAQRVMGFASPNQILVSRSYYEVVSRLSPDYDQLFHYRGLHRDKHVRDHEVYEVQLSMPSTLDSSREPSDAPATALEPGSETPRFEAGLLERLSAALALEIGPVAKLIVRRAAERATNVKSLGEALAENVPEPARPAFLARVAEVAGVTRTPAPLPRVAPGEAPAQTTAGTANEITPALLARVEQVLALQIGPVGRVLVRQAAKTATSARELFERLAAHIDDEPSRKAFIAEVERPDRGAPPG